MSKVRLRTGQVQVEIALDDTPTAEALLAALPFEPTAQTWVEGSAVALPFGRTPISGRDGKPKLVARCNVLGKVLGDAIKVEPC